MAHGNDNHTSEQAAEVISQLWLDAMLPAREAFVQRLFGVFIREEPKRVASIRDAVTHKDLDRIRYLAHSLKGAAATMGCEQVRRTCLEMEAAAEDHNLHEVKNSLDRLEQKMDCVYAKMNDLLKMMNRDDAGA
ncbi:MAG: Hpt domain-containing protein [Desulfovibrionaceae bacterium]